MENTLYASVGETGVGRSVVLSAVFKAAFNICTRDRTLET